MERALCIFHDKPQTIHMKRINLVLLALFAIVAVAETGAQTLPGLDASPADIVYFRPNGRNQEPTIAKVVYGRPSKKGRTMLGATEPYGKVWRLGANEATEIKLFQDVTFGDKKIKAGTYTMYAIPTEKEWTIIFNTKLDTWGAYSYEEGKDVARVVVPVGKTEKEVEAFTITFDGKGDAAFMIFAWENTLVKLPIKYLFENLFSQKVPRKHRDFFIYLGSSNQQRLENADTGPSRSRRPAEARFVRCACKGGHRGLQL